MMKTMRIIQKTPSMKRSMTLCPCSRLTPPLHDTLCVPPFTERGRDSVRSVNFGEFPFQATR